MNNNNKRTLPPIVLRKTGTVLFWHFHCLVSQFSPPLCAEPPAMLSPARLNCRQKSRTHSSFNFKLFLGGLCQWLVSTLCVSTSTTLTPISGSSQSPGSVSNCAIAASQWTNTNTQQLIQVPTKAALIKKLSNNFSIGSVALLTHSQFILKAVIPSTVSKPYRCSGKRRARPLLTIAILSTNC